MSFGIRPPLQGVGPGNPNRLNLLRDSGFCSGFAGGRSGMERLTDAPDQAAALGLLDAVCVVAIGARGRLEGEVS